MYASRRSPHGERELKSQSLRITTRVESRSPHGERELKCIANVLTSHKSCRSPHGERELKFADIKDSSGSLLSLPTRGA